MGFDKLKIFISEHKPQLRIFLVAALMFIVGFGTGRAWNKPKVPDSTQQSNYNVNINVKPETSESPAATIIEPKDDNSLTPQKPQPGQPCVVKGNISGSSKIYHIKGGASYDKVSPEACFNTETEAQAAGFRKAKR